MDEMIQTYLDTLYNPLSQEISNSLLARSNEIYGELYYQSVVELLKQVQIRPEDHFLDIGSGLGKLVFQVYLTTEASSVTGIEINHARYEISEKILSKMEQEFNNKSNLFSTNKINPNKKIKFIEGDFLKIDLEHNDNQELINSTTIAYVCATVFSFELIQAIGEKLSKMPHLHTIISLRKIPTIDRYEMSKKIFLHGTWDYVACYIYTRKA